MKKKSKPLLFCTSAEPHYSYTGEREQADALIKWLLDKGHWLEASYHINDYLVVCGCGPTVLLREAGIKTTSNGSVP